MEMTRLEYKRLVSDVSDAVVKKLLGIGETLDKVRDEQWLTTDEAAEYLRRSSDWVRRHKTVLRAKKNGSGMQGNLRFPKSALVDYIRES